MSVRLAGAALALAAVLGACKREAPAPPQSEPREASAVAPSAAAPPTDRWSSEGMLAEARLYLDDAGFRRSVLTDSLTNPKNTYSRQRLDAYGLGTRGWDLLPEYNPISLPITAGRADELRAGRMPTVPEGTAPLWNGVRPASMPEWVALGREVFFGYPLRSEVYMKWAIEHPAEAARVGIRPDAGGEFLGARLFVDVDGKAAIGITCAVCHTDVDAEGRATIGRARRGFDYGALRLAYHEATKIPTDPELARRMRTWGPGRADVTEDEDEDPVAIPDLWGLRHQTHLTQAATIRHVGPTALAIRQETQLLHSNHQKVRPPRELAYALAMYLYSLEPPPKPALRAAPKGKALFEEHCKGCHANEAYAGDPVSSARIGTDPALATGGARGTGKYRPAALLRVADAAPYFHQGAVPTLDDVLSPERLRPGYARSSLGKGPVKGHDYGTDLPAPDRAALVDYLKTL